MFKWHDLLKARSNMRNISHEIETLLKEHNALYKNELRAQHEKLAEQVDESPSKINKEYKEMCEHIKQHRKTLCQKSHFLKRHHDKG